MPSIIRCLRAARLAVRVSPRGRPWIIGRVLPGIALGALLGLGLGLLSGCATETTRCRAPVGPRGLTPAVVAAAAPHEHEGVRITWGGTLVEARNLETATELEMLALPLDSCGRPRLGEAALGRFIIVRPGFLETADLRPGRPISATGPIVGVREGRIGAADVRFPLLEDPAPRLWQDQLGLGRERRPAVSIGIGGGTGTWRGGWGGAGIGIGF